MAKGRTPLSPFFSWARRNLPALGGMAGGFWGPAGMVTGAAAGKVLQSATAGLSHQGQGQGQAQQPPVNFMGTRSQPQQAGYQQQQAGSQPQQQQMQGLIDAVSQPDVPAPPTKYGDYTVTGLPSGARAVNMPTRTAEQQGVQSQMAQQGMGLLGNLPQTDIVPLRAEYERDYKESVLPKLLEQFVSAGPGAMRTGGFQQTLGASQAGLQGKMAAMHQDFNMRKSQQDQGLALNLLGPVMQQQFQTGALDPQPNDWAPITGAAGAGALQQDPSLIGNMLDSILSGRNKTDDTEETRNQLMEQLMQLITAQQSQRASLNP